MLVPLTVRTTYVRPYAGDTYKNVMLSLMLSISVGPLQLPFISSVYIYGQIPRNGLTWGPVRNSGGQIITLIFQIFIINGLYSVI